MYTYVNAIARAKTGTGSWETVDISTMGLNLVYLNYAEIIATLTNPVIDGTVTVNFDDLPSTLRILTVSFPTWLASIGNTTLPTTVSSVSITETHARHVDAWYWGFDIKPANHTKHPDTELLHDEQVDLYLTKSGVDPLSLQKSCIATVNGMTHQLSSSTEGTFIIGGCSSGRVAKNNNVGLLDFSGLGEIETIDLNSTMVIAETPDSSLTESVTLDVGGSLFGKTVFLSFGGYFFALNQAYDVVGDQIVRINTRLMNLLARYYESRELVDWTNVFVPFEQSRVPDRVEREAFFTDDLIRRMLDMDQTFLVVLDATNIQIQYTSLGTTQLAGAYLAFGEEPSAPAVVNLGRLPEYLPVQEIDQYVLHFDRYMTRNPQRELTTLTDLNIFEDGSKTPHAERYANPRLMYIQKVTTG